MNRHCAWITLGALAALSAFGDVVIFKSGDRLTGTIKKVKDGKMTFDSLVAGEIKLKMEEIQTFSTDEPITIEKPDGSQVETTTSAGEEGRITLAKGGAAMPLTDIAEINPEAPAWHGQIVPGANISRSNTHSQNVNVNAEAGLRRENDRISLGGGYLFDRKRDNSTNKDDTIEDKWFLKGKYDYFVSDQLYVYGGASYEKDRINNLDMRFSPGGGLGYQWVESDDLNFNTEGGFNYVHEEYTDPDDTRDHIAVRLAYHLDKTLWENVKAFHNVTYLPSTERSDIYLIYADAGVQTTLIDNWILEAKAGLEHNSEPAAGLEKTDYRYTLGVGYTF